MQPHDQLPPHVVIDLKTIYDQLLILTTEVKLLMSKQVEHDRIDADHETRIRTLERARWPLPTVSVLVALAAAGIALAGLLTR